MTTVQEKVKSMQGGIKTQAEKTELPERFEVIEVDDKPQVILKDKKTGKRTEVDLYSYRNVRKALFDLFNE